MPPDRAPSSGEPLSGPPRDEWLARELRLIFDELKGIVVDAGDPIDKVEDAFELQYPRDTLGGGFKPPTDRAQARQDLPATLETVASVENQLRRCAWRMGKARRVLARRLRSAPTEEK